MVWYIVILVFMLYIWMLYFVSQNTVILFSRRILAFSALFLGFFMAFRAQTVGTDTKHYTYAYNIISQASWNEFLTIRVFAWSVEDADLEIGYRLFNKVLGIISSDSQVIIVGVSILLFALLYRNVLLYSKAYYLSIWLFFTLGLYQTSFNISRHALAIFIAFRGFKYIEEKKLIPYLLVIVVASLFHQSCMYLLPLYWLANYARLHYKQVNICILCMPFLLLIINVLIKFFSSVLPIRYQRYLMTEYSKPEGVLVSIVFLLVFYFIRFFTYKEKMEKAIDHNSIGTWMLILNAFLSVLGYNYSIFYRASMIFGYYMIFYIPALLMETDSRRINSKSRLGLLIAITMMIYIVRIHINNIGSTMPFSFFWE